MSAKRIHSKASLGMFGYGAFGQFLVAHLAPHFELKIYDRRGRAGEYQCSKEVAASADIVMLGVPVQYLDSLLSEIHTFIRPNALVVDVCSVKIKPIELMLKWLPQETEIIGMHPLFGPQSGKNGIAGLNCVVTPVRTSQMKLVRFFVKDVLFLNYLQKTADEHDHEMAYVQGLTHFIGRAVSQMDIPDLIQKTPAYQHLLDIKRNLGGDSLDLFLSIEKENPYTAAVRRQFQDQLDTLESQIKA